MNQIDLQGRVAVVTGGAQGIGYAICERLLRSGAGVVLWDSDAARLAEACATLTRLGPARGEVIELTDDAAVAGATAKALATEGRIDILVNNAGITGGNASTWELDPSVWRRVIEVKCTGIPRRPGGRPPSQLPPDPEVQLPDFKPKLQDIRSQWGFEKTSDILEAMYRSAINGNALAQKLWLKYFDDFDPKHKRKSESGSIQPVFHVNDIRFLIESLPKDLQEKYYTFLRDLIVDIQAMHEGRTQHMSNYRGGSTM